MEPEQEEVVMDLGVNSIEDANSEQTISSGSRWTTYQSPLRSYPLSRWHLHLTDPSDFSNVPIAGGSSGPSILTSSGSFSSNSASGLALVNSKDATIPGSLLRSLKMVTLFKSLDPGKRICQFEIPGGGACRDDECEDLHIERELETWEPSGASGILWDGVLLTLSMLTSCLARSVPRLSFDIISPFSPPWSNTSFLFPSLGFLSADDDTAQYLSEALATSSQDQRPTRSPTDVKNALEETRTRTETMELGFEDRISAALSILGVS